MRDSGFPLETASAEPNSLLLRQPVDARRQPGQGFAIAGGGNRHVPRHRRKLVPDLPDDGAVQRVTHQHRDLSSGVGALGLVAKTPPS